MGGMAKRETWYMMKYLIIVTLFGCSGGEYCIHNDEFHHRSTYLGYNLCKIRKHFICEGDIIEHKKIKNRGHK